MSDITHILGGAWAPQEKQLDPPEIQLLNAINESGLEPDIDHIVIDGNIHRFNTGGRKGKTGWYVAFADGVPAGKFGCWRQDIEQTWRADTDKELSAADQMAYTRRMAEAKRLRDEERAKLQEVTADVVADIWANAQAATDDHPYLKAKGVKSHGLRITGDGRLVAPMYDAEGNLSSLQYISHDGAKRYHKSGQTSGTTWILGTPDNAKTVYIAEGYATAATVHEETGQPCVVAYSASNLPAATEQAVKHSLPVVIMADNDEGGIGRKYADQACAQYGASYVMPPTVGMDANDWVQAGNRLADILEAEDDWLEPVTADWLAQPAPLKWIIKGWMPEKCLGMLHGPSGAGKTFVMLSFAMSIATGQQWQGKATKPGCVVYLAGEGNYGLRSRVAAWMQETGHTDADMFVSKSGCDLNTAEGWTKAMQYLRRVAQTNTILMVVVDTLHRFLKGDENSAEDAKTMIDACDGIKRELGTSVWLVHHTGLAENAQNRARGSSAWRGALDVELGLTAPSDDKPGALIQHKMKDAEQSMPMQFKLRRVAIDGWEDDEGDQVHGAVVEWLGECEPQRKETPVEKATHDFYRAWVGCDGEYDSQGRPHISVSAWRNWLVKKEEKSEATAKKKTSPGTAGSPSYTLGYLVSNGKMVDGDIAGMFAYTDEKLFAKYRSAGNLLKK